MASTPLRALPLVLLALTVFPASRAEACGGFGCDRGPSVPDAFGNPPPTQSGEEIVYGMESDGSLVMSVRIFYQGAAPDFAWILPVPATPTVSLGTDVLFDTLKAATQPRFYVTTGETEGTCAADPICAYPDVGFFADAGFAASDAATDGAVGPMVELMTTLGPYEIVVLSGGTGAEVRTWLTDHSYVTPAEFGPLLDDYAMHGSHFVALRLRGDATVDQIQPITLTMPGVSPCLPIRLTALATQPDLPITAFFLADGRVVSSNYSMLDPDYADVGLYTGGTSWFSYVTRLADTAGGHAFATDFAGPTGTYAFALPSVLDLASETDPSAFLIALQSRGYLADPHILAILGATLVPPMGMMPRAYYNCLIFGPPFTGIDTGGCGMPQSFDAMMAATLIDQTITQPRADAQALVARHPYTTRLFTTLSADEMTLDPEFRLDSALPALAAVRTATRTTVCDADHYRDEAGSYWTTQAGLRFGEVASESHATPDEWCRRHGARLPGSTGSDGGSAADSGMDGGHYPDGAVAPPRVASGGGGCSAGRSGGGAWSLAIGIALLAASRRARMLSSRR